MNKPYKLQSWLKWLPGAEYTGLLQIWMNEHWQSNMGGSLIGILGVSESHLRGISSKSCQGKFALCLILARIISPRVSVNAITQALKLNLKSLSNFPPKADRSNSLKHNPPTYLGSCLPNGRWRDTAAKAYWQLQKKPNNPKNVKHFSRVQLQEVFLLGAVVALNDCWAPCTYNSANPFSYNSTIL